MTSDPIQKFKLVDEIIEYIKDIEYDRIASILDHFGIKYHDKYGNSISSYNQPKQHLNNATEDQIHNLYKYLFDEKIETFFDDKYATPVLQEKFVNLNLYLNECLACINNGNNIAATILLRSCVEIFLKESGQEGKNLATDIENLITSINTDSKNKDVFEIFTMANQLDALKIFLDDIRKLGRDVVHIKKDDIEGYISKHNQREFFQLFCTLIENSILRDGIHTYNTKAKADKMKFKIPDTTEKIPTFEHQADTNDEIPF